MRGQFRRGLSWLPFTATAWSVAPIKADSLRVFSTSAPRHSSFRYRNVRVSPEDRIDPLQKPTIIDKAALHVVSVPIGNLKDFSLRALDTLRGVDYIVTSDRPATRTLLDLVDIPSQGRLIHYSRSNRTATRDKLVELLKGGRSMALVTTGGTPCVGDVGAELVQEMQAQGVRVTAVPGPSAVMSALAMCGVTGSKYESAEEGDEDRDGGGSPSAQQLGSAFQDGSFFFGNMLPESHGARLRLLRNVVAPAHYPCVFYEVPRRLLLVLQDIAAILPQRRVYIAHELTKLNESLHADTAERLMQFYLKYDAQMLLKRGQVVLVIAGAGPAEIAAWLEREVAKRHRLRRDVKTMTTAAEPTLQTRGSATTTTSANGGDRSRLPSSTGGKKQQRLKVKRAARLRRRRERLIAAIEKEQEHLRLKMRINAADASKLQ